MELALHRELARVAALADRSDLIDTLIDELLALRAAMLDSESRLQGWLDAVDPARRASAGNVAHHLALRRHDLRGLHERLVQLGAAPLREVEAQGLARLDAVLALLHRLAGRRAARADAPVLEAANGAGALREHHAEALFGTLPPERSTRLVVTVPADAARDPVRIGSLVHAGMDVARIVCASGTPADWIALAAQVRRIADTSGHPVRILIELAGNTIRTGPIEPGPCVLKLKPERDAFGAVIAPVRVGLRPAGADTTLPGARVHLAVDAAWLAQLEAGDRIEVDDARGSTRRWAVVGLRSGGALVEVDRTTYLTEHSRPRLRRKGAAIEETALHELPRPEGRLHLQRGEILRLKRDGLGLPASNGASDRRVEPASIACTPPEVLDRLKRGERVRFDDGRIGGIVRRVTARGTDIEITEAPEGGATLAANRRVHLPDSALRLAALTDRDLADLELVARHADIVALPQLQSAADVRALRRRLAELGAPSLGLLLKVDTRRGFERLPELLFAALDGAPVGVQIAGDELAVECGVEHLAEVQNELQRIAAAAHLPVLLTARAGDGASATLRPHPADAWLLEGHGDMAAALRVLADQLRRLGGPDAEARPAMRTPKASAATLDAAA